MSIFDDIDAAMEFFYRISGMSDNISRETWRNRTYYDNTQPEEKWEGEPKERFTPEQRARLDSIKARAIDVEYEEV